MRCSQLSHVFRLRHRRNAAAAVHAFRSYLLPFAAVITNLLAVTAGYGRGGIFQLGWLNGLVGARTALYRHPLEVPLMVFCLSFGLSMDYELFCCFASSRIRHHRITRARPSPACGVAP